MAFPEYGHYEDLRQVCICTVCTSGLYLAPVQSAQVAVMKQTLERFASSPMCSSVQAENDMQQALDLLSNPMCNAALQQAIVAHPVDPQTPSLPQSSPTSEQQSLPQNPSASGVSRSLSPSGGLTVWFIRTMTSADEKSARHELQGHELWLRSAAADQHRMAQQSGQTSQ